MGLLNNTRIATRLGLGFALILSLFILTTGIAIWRLNAVAEATRAMMDAPLAKERAIADWYRNIHTGIRRIMAIAKSKDPGLATFFAPDAEESTRQSTALQKTIEGLLANDRERQLFNEVGELRKRYISTRDTITKAKKEGREEEAEALFEQTFRPITQTYVGKLQELLDMQRASIDTTAKEINALYERSFTLTVSIGVGTLALGILLAWLIAGSIRRPLDETVQAMERVAAGDLRIDLRPDPTQNHELARLQQATATMVSQLSAMIRQLQEQSTQLSTAANTLSGASGQVQQGSEEQSEATASMAAALEQMSTSISHVAGLSQDAQQLSRQSGGQAQAGEKTIHDMVVDISGIADAIREASRTAEMLGQESQRISGITAVIKDVADQTNLLALNAAIEAARAGEQGRGFAVVADEVRKLAEKTGGSAQEIADMVTSIQGGARAMANQMAVSVERVEAGMALAGDAGQAIGAINTSTEQVVQVIEDVSTALNEQSTASQEIAGRVESIVQMIEENNQSMAAVARTADDLDALASQLQRDVARFRLAA